MGVPMGHQLPQWAGEAYLEWLAWQAMKLGVRSPIEVRQLPQDRGFLLSILPQFISPEYGSVSVQSLLLGTTQMAVIYIVNLLIAVFAATLAGWFVRTRVGHPSSAT